MKLLQERWRGINSRSGSWNGLQTTRSRRKYLPTNNSSDTIHSMILTPEAKKYGKKMQELSYKYVTKNAKLFKDTQWEEQDVKMIFCDAANLFLAGSYMIEGDFDAAMGVVAELDTAVRDEIPKSIYNYLCKFTLDQE